MMRNNKIKASLLALFITLPAIAKANVVWPSLYIVGQYYVWYIILAGLIIEILSAKMFMKTSWKMSILTMVAVNAISAIVGLLLIPVSGIVVEFATMPFGGSTFDLSHWILDYLSAVIVNTCVEGLSLKWIFNKSFKSNFWWLFCANLISVIISVIVSPI